MVIYDWTATLSLIFGGCCSNAISLEQLIAKHPHTGSLITFSQFLIISLHGLPKHIIWTHYGPRLKQRRIPITPYLIQVALFYFISLLNNAAFAYHIPMTVHIIFRSGGLIISMLLGWFLVGKRYTSLQISSVLLVTLGITLTTLSASGSTKSSPTILDTSKANSYTYAMGIAILTLALVLSGFLGLVQDWTYTKYGRPAFLSSSNGLVNTPDRASYDLKQTAKKSSLSSDSTPAWQESMFYLHALALPMFLSMRKDLANQFSIINAGPCFSIPISIPPSLSTSVSPFIRSNLSFLLASQRTNIRIPKMYLPLLINTLTQLLCVAGVHRLTTRVSALTVTLILVVRKAISLVLSVVGFGMWKIRDGAGWEKQEAQEVNVRMMWVGAVMVLLGTVGYSASTGARVDKKTKDKNA